MDNLTNNQLYSHLLDLLQFFCFHMLFIIFYWLIKEVFSINHDVVLEKKVYLLLESLVQPNDLNLDFVLTTLVLINTYFH